MNQATDVVIVGAGPAGATAAATLRKTGYPGTITVVRGEDGRPYNRTTVNKALLQGQLTVDAVTLPEADTPDVDWTTPDRATAQDTEQRIVTLASGRSLRYRHLIITTGALPRPFPGEAAAGAADRVVSLRCAADSDRLRTWLTAAEPPTVTILGAGLIGSGESIAVDHRLRARGAAGVYAAGDLARITDDAGRGHRVEHFNDALSQGRHVALALLHDIGDGDDPGRYDTLATYSTRLYGTKLTVVGHSPAFARETVIAGDVDHGRFTVALTDTEDKLTGIVGVGGARVANSLKDAVREGRPLAGALAGATSGQMTTNLPSK